MIPEPTAYSYIRFSSAKQELGDSVRRQLRLAEDYATQHNLQLDTSSYQDLGVSAFRGKNVVEGKLGTFIEAVERGLIPRGSYLLVESLDRISRAEVDEALELFLRIIRGGVTIVTLTDQQIFSRESIKKDRGIGLIVSILVMIRAHEESLTKSTRVRAAWLNKREGVADGKLITSMAPAWLKPNAEKTAWVIDELKASVIRRIFTLSLEGNGTPTIAKLFNAERVPTMQRAANWTFGTVNALLKNEAVIGNYVSRKTTDEPMKGYYPAIVSETQFYQVRDGLKNRTWVGGRSSHAVRNFFAGNSYCSVCQNQMRVKSTRNLKTYLNCTLAHAGGDCQSKNFPYYAAERAIVKTLYKAINSLELSLDQENPRLVLEAKRDEINAQLANVVDAISISGVSQLKDKLIMLQGELEAINAEIVKAATPIAIKDTEVLNEELIEGLPAQQRRKIQVLLKRVVSSVHFDTENLIVAVKYRDHIRRPVDFIDVRPFMDKVGGYRPKRYPIPQ